MKYNFGILVFLVLLVSSCSNQNKLIFEAHKFEIKGFDWDPNPYKFSGLIKDSVLQHQGVQYASWDYSYIGDIQNMLKTWDVNATPTDSLTDLEVKAFKEFKRISAIPTIVKKAKQTEVIIINEAHQMPQHRVFTTSLLQKLYDEGYRHLGMESVFASKKSDSILMANQYPILTNGYYIKEPQYGNIVRQALKIGYQIFGYESNGHSNAKEREINQAKNIKQYIDANPDGKYLIHCGFAHGIEGIYGGSWEKAMAGRLREFMNIDPLTINQTTYSEKSDKAFENPYYQLTNVNEPSIFVKNDSIFGQYRKGSWFDISVFHPRTNNFNRPNWLLIGDRIIENINFKNAEIDCPCLVFAYLGDEEIGKAIPYDIQEMNNKTVNLVLEKGIYQVIIWNMNGKALKTTIKIK